MLSVAGETGAAAVLAGLLVWSSLAGAASGVVTADGPTAVPGDSDEDGRTERLSAFQVADNETNSSTTRHENPIRADEEGDTDAVAAALASSLADRINRSTVELSREEYEIAESRVGDQYKEELGQYVDVAGTADGSVDPEEFRTVGEEQRRLVNESREFDETYESYEEARRAGDTERARRLARELSDHSENISRTTRRQRRNLRAVNNSSSADLSGTIRETQELNRSVQERRQTAVESEFVGTVLTAEAERQQASFGDPLPIRGRLTDGNGSALANREVTIAVGERNYTVRTDAQGQFTVRYRPTTVRIDREAVTVRYVPAETSVYRDASASVSVTLEQTTPSLTLDESPATARYGETVAVRGRVTVDSVPVPNVPVAVTIGDTRIAVARTDEDGVFDIQSPLPADVDDGEQSLDTRIVQSDRAIGARNATTGITVAQTGTNLTLTGIDFSGDSLDVTGTLVTDTGSPVPDQQVALRLDDTTVTTGTTDQDGAVTLNASLDTDEVSDRSTLALRFDGTGTNLESSTVQRSVPLGDSDGESLGSTVLALFVGSGQVGFGPSIGASRGAVALLVGVVVVVIVGSGLYVELRRLDPSRDAGGGSDGDGEAVTDATASDTRTDTVQDLDAAAALLDPETADDAVLTAYFAVRDEIPGTSASGDWRHWRYYESLNGELNGETEVEFRRLTELYEHAAFAQQETTVGEAREAVDIGETIVDALKSNGAVTDGT